ncbi:MAG: 50S ribosomal protein L25 [Candidatus Omnitrophica bacterium]|nr:50S ribosomal protein L25 [Candidatus Omnitrophota bacterium]
MEKIKMETVLRERIGKEGAKKVRQAGNVPGVVYGMDTNISIQISVANLKQLRAVNFSESAIIDMEISGLKKKEKASVLVKDVQYHPLTEEVIHIDFLKVSLDEVVKVHVPLLITGDSPSVKEGGTLEQIHRDIEVECLPLDIPQNIEVDVSNLTVGHSIHIGDLKIADNIKVITPLEETVVTVVIKEEEKEEEEGVPEEAPLGEPEVIKEKKDDAASK